MKVLGQCSLGASLCLCRVVPKRNRLISEPLTRFAEMARLNTSPVRRVYHTNTRTPHVISRPLFSGLRMEMCANSAGTHNIYRVQGWRGGVLPYK